MAIKLADGIVKELPAPAAGNKVTYDTEVKGFGCRVTAKGARAFVLNYRTRTGLERRYTIGQAGNWSVKAAREEAKRLKQEIDRGADPLKELTEAREAPTVKELFERFTETHLPRKRPSTRADYQSMIESKILPEIGSRKVADIEFADIEKLHCKISKRAPTRANRVVAVVSKAFKLAETWKMRPAHLGNPAKGIERNAEVRRDRYLTAEELGRLTKALAEYANQQAANVFRLCLLTGARVGEVTGATWSQFDLAAGTWTKPSSHTKQKKLHHVPLSAPARQLLAELYESREEGAEFVFPGRGSDHLSYPKKDWAAIRKAAKIEDVRIHDQRHTYASMLASGGQSLPMIGALLGHTQPATTARYAHLFVDPLRKATESVGAIVSGSRPQPSSGWGRVRGE